MPPKFELSNGALKVIMKGDKVDDPIMQVLGSKKIANASVEKERYRLLLSDGKYLFSFAMVTTQNNERIVAGEMPIYSIIKLNRYITSVINNTNKAGDKRILVILDMELLQNGDEIGERIGDPIPLGDDTDDKESNQSSNNNKSETKAKPVLSGTSNSSVNLNSTSLQDQLIHPIASLSPYQNKWVIKARIMSKSPIRTWSNSRGEGKLFSMDLIDESGEIRITGFREAVDKFYEMVQVDKVYFFTRCQVKMANKQYSNLKNDYELTIGNDTVIEPCSEDTDSIPTTQFNFVPIDKLANVEVGTIVDVIAISKSATDLNIFTSKTTQREMKKRELTLVDMSKASISLTIWGAEAENYNFTEAPVIAIKGARLGEFGGGKNLSCPGSAIIKYNPDIPDAFVIRGWYDNGGVNEEANNISARTGLGGTFTTSWMSFKEVKDQGLGNSERGDYYQTKGTVLLLKSDNCFYKACPQENCNKKVVDLENGVYRCEKCKVEYPNFKYRLLANVNVGDWSGNQWMSMFTNEVEKILGRTSQEVGEAAEMGEDALINIANEANFKEYIFKCRAKMETYNDEARLKTVAIKVDKVNYKEYNQFLISQIQQLTS